MPTKQQLLSYIKENKNLYKHLKELIETDLKDLTNHLCLQRNPDEKTHLQGQILKLNEYLKLIS